MKKMMNYYASACKGKFGAIKTAHTVSISGTPSSPMLPSNDDEYN